MTFGTLILRSLRFHVRLHAGALLGAAIGSAVLIGALVVGDSVRGSLRANAMRRLAGTHLAVDTGDRFFTASLAGRTAAAPGVSAMLRLPATAARQDNSARANHIVAYGVDKQFLPDATGIPAGDVWLNEALARQLNATTGDDLIFRVHKPSALSRDAVIVPRDDTSVALRLKVERILPSSIGDFSLTPGQSPPLNAFLSIDQLGRAAHLEGRANLLVARDPSPIGGMPGLQSSLDSAWSLADAELELRDVPEEPAGAPANGSNSFVELRTTRIFLDPLVANAALAPSALTKSPERSGAITNGIRVLTYLVNLIRAGDRATPYSMVTAIDTSALTSKLEDDEILLNEWLADDLGVRPGGTIDLSYYVLDAGAQLVERTNTFRVAGIVPMVGLYADRSLMPEFPGLAKAESTHDWDAGFKLIHEIRARDEDYWKKYRGTPKAFVTLAAGQKMWANRFGDLTAIRWPASARDVSLHTTLAENLRANLQLAQFGFRLEAVRDRALKAAEQSQDFAGLFLGFSFFLIVAALLLMALLFRFGIEQRATEVGTFLALGFTPRQVRRLLLLEGGALAFISGMAGVVGGIWYAKAMLSGLSTVWRDAVSGSTLEFHVEPLTLVVGALSSITVAWITIGIALRDQARRTARELLAEGAIEGTGLQVPENRRRHVALVVGVLAGLSAIGMVGWSMVQGDTANAESFFTAGALLLIAGLSLVARVLARLRARTSRVQYDFSLSGLGVRNCSRRRSRSLATVSLLACGSFLIASIGAFRLDAIRDAHERTSGTGGFALIGESALPVVQDLNSRSGQEYFGLGASDLESVSVVPLRVRDGEDASCLNLNRAQRPRLLGVNPELLAGRGAFRFAKTIRETTARNPWTLLEPDHSSKKEDRTSTPASVTIDELVPAIGDEASILWAMGKKVGDTLDYVDEHGRPFKVQIVGAVANSILQGNLLIDEKSFVNHFPSESGYRMFLIDAPSKNVTNVSAVLSRAMRDVGLELTPATVRLAAFNAVQNTYLGTFQTLGGLGLLLGSAGLGVVVLRNVLDRRGELALLSAVGLRSRAVRWLVLSEHGALLIAGLGIGVVSAGVTVLPTLLSPAANVPYVSLVITLAAVLASGALWTWVATRIALRGRMLDALRNE